VTAPDPARAWSTSDVRTDLRLYYADVGPEQRALLAFLVRHDQTDIYAQGTQRHAVQQPE
jgi:hypothetical protein